jgi:hypothetical protein
MVAEKETLDKSIDGIVGEVRTQQQTIAALRG